MKPEAPKLLEDIRDSGSFILQVTLDRTQQEYEQDRLVRQAVERNFEIIGEALNQLAKTDPDTANRMCEVPRIIAFRNILAHAYDIIDHEIVWHVIQNDLPDLVEKAETLLAEAEGPENAP